MFKKFLFSLIELLKVIAIAALIVIPIRYFLFQPFLVRGSSMEPSFYSNDYLIVDQISYRFSSPERGEVIVFDYPRNRSQRFIKRIIGLPGEKIELKENNIFINEEILNESEYIKIEEDFRNKTFDLGSDEYFVLGDNRGNSSDSRNWGPINKDDIVGRAILRLFPFNDISKITSPSY